MRYFGTLLGPVPADIEIITGGIATPALEIGDDSAGIYFSAEEAVRITGECDNVFYPVLTSSAVVRLETDRFLEDLFRADVMEATVKITAAGETVFKGYVLPQSYSQPFQEVLDTLEVNLIDSLSALIHLPFRRVFGSEGEQMSFEAAFEKIFSYIGSSWSVTGHYLLPGNVSVLKATFPTGVFLGEDETEDSTVYDALSGLLQYLNLHAEMRGESVELFRWEKKKSGTAIDIGNNNVWGLDGQIELGEIYNQISLSVESDAADPIPSPLVEDGMTSPFDSSQLYCTEYSMKTGVKEWQQYWRLMKGYTAWGDNIWRRDWYIRTMEARGWKFYGYFGGAEDTLNRFDGTPHGQDFYTRIYQGSWSNQEMLPDAVTWRRGGALLRVGTVKTTYAIEDHSSRSKLEETDCLVIGVGGMHSDAQSAYVRASNLASQVRAWYEGEDIRLSPESEEVTRYIVISGSVGLATEAPTPKTWKSWTEGLGAQTAVGTGDFISSVNTIGADDPERVRYFMRRYFTAHLPEDTPYDALQVTGYKGDGNDAVRGLEMWDPEESERRFEYKGQLAWDGSQVVQADNRTKIGVLVCMLRIGDKVLVEADKTGAPESYVWVPYKSISQCSSREEWLRQTFTIGFDPKKGDHLCGPEHEISNNVDFGLGISVTGMAIPVRKSDNLSGKVRFAILGPCDIIWHKAWLNQYDLDYISGTSENLPSGAVRVMDYVSNIWLKDFKVEVVSDNAGDDPLEEGEIVYTSDEYHQFRNSYETDTLRIGSELTTEERRELKLRDMMRNNLVRTPGGTGLLSVSDPVTDREGKPEQLYVDWYYRECKDPKITLKMSLRTPIASVWNTYRHPALAGRSFFPLAVERDFSDGSSRFTLREI